MPSSSASLLLAVFVHIETRAEEPILPLRLFADRTRTTANVARGLVYAGMYGMFFFLGQFLQDVQGYSPLRAGVGFLPVPLVGLPLLPAGEQGAGAPGPAQGR